jgi:uncharacterized protein YndB with AHSA1/START domain
MATIAITPDQDTILGEIFIAAPPSRVFQALTDPQQMPQWWGQKEMYRVTKFEADVRAGGKWRSSGVSAKGEKFEVGGEYLEVDPPRRLVQTWNADWSHPLTTRLCWELQEQNSGTLVKITHSGFAGHAAAAQDHASGWRRVLSWLEAYVGQGQTIETRWLARRLAIYLSSTPL